MDSAELTGAEVKRLMRTNKLTIACVAKRWGLTQKRVRQVRSKGVMGSLACWEWRECFLNPKALPPWHEGAGSAKQAA